MLLVPMPQLLRKARNTFKNAFMGKQGNWMTQMQIKTFFLFFFYTRKGIALSWYMIHNQCNHICNYSSFIL